MRHSTQAMLTCQTLRCTEQGLFNGIKTSASPQSDTSAHANVLFQSVESDYPLPASDIP